LPFGVWFSRHHPQARRDTSGQIIVSIAFRRLVQSSPYSSLAGSVRLLGLHCLSAFGSVVTRPFHADVRQSARVVSIAFRRLVQSSHMRMRNDQRGLEVSGLHCLSAFGSVVTRSFGRTTRADVRRSSPLPFGVWFSRHPAGRYTT